ncbi:hypothetical protein [Neolewinella persica]|uniref:hypothetical protein n=1 Tax=Neolewinella persica TaxID=70998 RepID=UPI00036AF405|nr:hypothetical protein [Neolewinella persica]
MQNPIAAKPLYIRIPLIILSLVSTTLILDTVFDFLPEVFEKFTPMGYLGLFICNIYMLWIMYQARQANENKVST